MVRMVIDKPWGKGEIGSFCVIAKEFQFCKIKKKDLWMDGDDDYTTMWMYLIKATDL